MLESQEADAATLPSVLPEYSGSTCDKPFGGRESPARCKSEIEGKDFHWTWLHSSRRRILPTWDCDVENISAISA